MRNGLINFKEPANTKIPPYKVLWPLSREQFSLVCSTSVQMLDKDIIRELVVRTEILWDTYQYMSEVVPA